MKMSILTIAFVIAFAIPAFAQKKKQLPPTDGTEFKMSPETPKYVTCDIEFRDPTDEKWPNFFYGKPNAPGKFVWSSKLTEGSFGMTCDKMAQRTGDQDRKVLAELLTDGKPLTVSLMVKSFGVVVMEKDSKGKPAETFPVKAQLTIASKTTDLTGTARVKWNYGKDAEYPENALLTLSFNVKGSDLGLKSIHDVQVNAFTTVFRDLPKSKGK